MAIKKPAAKKTVKEQPAAKKEPVVVKPKIVMYVSKKIVMRHPYQNIRFFPGSPIACIMDSWLDAQLKAGLIEEVK